MTVPTFSGGMSASTVDAKAGRSDADCWSFTSSPLTSISADAVQPRWQLARPKALRCDCHNFNRPAECNQAFPPNALLRGYACEGLGRERSRHLLTTFSL